MRKHSLLIIFLLFLSLVAVLPLLQSGFFSFHDDTQIARVFEMKKALSTGEFPVRWVPDLGYGYGYPIFNFYAPLAYYVGGVIAFFLPALVATKVMIAIGMLLAGFAMYLLAKQLFPREAAVVSALLYMYAPYHAVDLYVRGAIAELWAYAFIPLMFYGFYKLFLLLKENKKQRTENIWIWIAIAALSFAGVILSHNLTALMVTPFLLFFLAILGIRLYKRNKNLRFCFLFFAFCTGLLLSAFYWLPALWEMGYTNVLSQTGGGSQYKDHFVCMMQLWSSQWGYGGSIPGCLDGLSFQLGKLHILLGILALPAFIVAKRKQASLVILLCIGFFISVFLLLPVSKPVWDSLSFMKFIQFPWRFLGLAVFFLSLLGGYAVAVFQNIFPKKPLRSVISSCLVVLLFAGMMVLYAKYFHPQIIDKNYRDETNLQTIRWTISKISDEYMPPDFAKPKDESQVANIRIINPEGSVFYHDRLTQITALVDGSARTTLQVNLAAFPDWNFRLDNKPVNAAVIDGRYAVAVPAGKHTLDVYWQPTPVEKLADFLSVVGLCGLILGIILQRKKVRNAKTS